MAVKCFMCGQKVPHCTCEKVEVVEVAKTVEVIETKVEEDLETKVTEVVEMPVPSKDESDSKKNKKK